MRGSAPQSPAVVEAPPTAMVRPPASGCVALTREVEGELVRSRVLHEDGAVDRHLHTGPERQASAVVRACCAVLSRPGPLCLRWTRSSPPGLLWAPHPGQAHNPQTLTLLAAMTASPWGYRVTNGTPLVDQRPRSRPVFCEPQ